MLRDKLLLLISLCLLTFSVSASNDINNMRVWPSEGSTRVVFDLKNAPEFTYFTLRNPDRLVIDLAATKSDTTLVEPYSLAGLEVFHFDLYRLADPEELEFMGIRDYFGDNRVCLIEWPQNGGQNLAPADLVISIEPDKSGRRFSIAAISLTGRAALQLCKRI